MTSRAARSTARGFWLALATTLLVTAALSASAGSYSFQSVNVPNDTFTQLLGVNNAGVIVDYERADFEALEAMARERQNSIASLIRQAVRDYVRRQRGK
jgi:hypothetical protein